MAICVCPKLTVSRSCSWRPSVHAKCAHQSPPSPTLPLVFHHSCAAAARHARSQRESVCERERESGSFGRAQRSVAISSSNFEFRLQLASERLSARPHRQRTKRNGRTGESERKKVSKKAHEKKAAQKREKKLKVNYRRLAAAAPLTAAAAVACPASE